MDTPPAATVHKKNVHVGGGKTFNMRKPIKLKPAGKRRKALADFRDTYAPSSAVSNAAHGKQQMAGADLFTTQKQIVNRASKVANLNTRSVSHGNFEMGSKPLNHVLSSDEESEWDADECDCSTWAISEDEESFYNLTSMDVKRRLPFLNLSTQSDDKGNEIEDFRDKRRKALADFRDTYAPSSGVSNAAHGKQQMAGADLFTTKKQIVNRASKVANLNTRSVPHGNFEMGSKPLNHVLSSDEESEWDADECDCSTWAWNLSTQSDNKGYESEDSDLHSPMSFPGPGFYTPVELPDDFFGPSRVVQKMYHVPELKFKDYSGLDNDNGIGGKKTKVGALAELEKGFVNKINGMTNPSACCESLLFHFSPKLRMMIKPSIIPAAEHCSLIIVLAAGSSLFLRSLKMDCGRQKKPFLDLSIRCPFILVVPLVPVLKYF
ncbi:hypothetical protein KSP39_PZI008954 [Platanthera zijinensis]|uniref:Uncharacterized protein n=1 Tax=Platanthera zijinensis TaxID=2320716 RepID=A0AAP0BM77_9ASPA